MISFNSGPSKTRPTEPYDAVGSRFNTYKVLLPLVLLYNGQRNAAKFKTTSTLYP
jgi:hypothetical protein